MVVDHVNRMWLGDKIFAMTLVGRTTFPLFCYAVAVAVKKMEGNAARLNQYIFRLLLLALAAEPVSVLTRNEGMVNVVFTLACGALFAGLARRMKDGHVMLCYLLAVISMFLPQTMEFGLLGAALPSAILLVMENRLRFLPWLIALLTIVNLGGSTELFDHVAPAAVAEVLLVSLLSVTLLPGLTLRIGQDLPQDGRFLPKYFFHAFYPGHLFVLWIAKLIFFGS